MWTGPLIDVGIEHKLLLMPVYMLCPIYLDLTLDPNYPDEPEELISVQSQDQLMDHFTDMILIIHTREVTSVGYHSSC